jgi:transmembrane sensor
MSEFADELNGGLQRESLEWIVRLTSGQATASDAEALAAWKARSPAHVTAFEDALRLRQALQLAGKEYVARQSGNVNIHSLAPRARHSFNRRAVLGGAVAATVAGGVMLTRPPLGLWPSFAELTADYRTATGEQRRITLAHGVSVQLNTQTALSVSPQTGGPTITLVSGEAVFHADLDHAAQLTVVAGNSTVVASRANFNVLHEKGGGCVTCLDGMVAVRRLGGSVTLNSGQQLAYAASEPGTVASVNRAQVAAWQEGLLVFHDMPFSQMVHEINRYRSGKVILADDALAKKRFNGVFHVGRLDGMVPAIQRLGVRVRELPGGIVLLG